MTRRCRSTGWEQAIRRMRAGLAADSRNHRMLADPWERAIHSMVQSWRIRHSMGPGRRPKHPPVVPRSWEEFVRRATQKAGTKAGQPLPGTWEYWAKLRTHTLVRYVPKRNRWVCS